MSWRYQYWNQYINQYTLYFESSTLYTTETSTFFIIDTSILYTIEYQQKLYFERKKM